MTGKAPLPYPEDLQAAERMLALTPSQLPLAQQLVIAARHQVNILLMGEAGTGKSRLARILHDLSGAAANRFLTLSCALIGQDLVNEEPQKQAGALGGIALAESEATACSQSTLVLDEIDTLDLKQQTSLLGLLETSRQARASGTRIIALSKRLLNKEVENGRFRTDLYFHLSGLAFYLPALRERTGDILPLARDMIARASAQFGKDPCEISPEALEALRAYSWPGNIRQLENVLQQVVLLNAEPVLLLRHLPKSIQARRADLAEATERSTLYRVLAKHDYNYTRAARDLGISRVWLYKKLKKYGIVRKSKPLML
jgi:DNA-binding NtrC family response regulator